MTGSLPRTAWCSRRRPRWRAAGWAYDRIDELPAVRAANLRCFAGYRHSRYARTAVIAALGEVLAEPGPLRAGAAEVGDPPTVLPVLFAMLRCRGLAADLDNRVLDPASAVWATARYDYRRPAGEWTQIDSTPLDVRVVHDDGTVGRVELTGLVDQATRTIAAALLRSATKAVDAALLLARALTPELMRPGWTRALRLTRSVLPHQSLTAIDERLEHAAARPRASSGGLVPGKPAAWHGLPSPAVRRAARHG
ncbi:MAG: hypothetical protein ACLQFR_31980 [Streptosporangiaceae bacterium]